MMLYNQLVVISSLLVLVVARMNTNKSPSVGAIAPSFNADLMMRALGVPSCVRRCVDPFMEQASKLWHLRDIVENVKPLCRSHEQATQCLKKARLCDTHNLFKTASSSVTRMCGERAALFEKMKPCLTKYADATAQLCDNKCHGRSNVTAFLNNPAIIRAARMGGSLLTVNDHLGSLCSSFNCMLPCATIELNKVCPLSGWLTLDILLQPVEAVSDLMLKATPAIKDFVAKKMDKRCRFAIQKSEIMKMRKGQFNY
ncbi:hypothetical protein OSTOST_08556, partial [Ostertagia ostertagi]